MTARCIRGRGRLRRGSREFRSAVISARLNSVRLASSTAEICSCRKAGNSWDMSRAAADPQAMPAAMISPVDCVVGRLQPDMAMARGVQATDKSAVICKICSQFWCPEGSQSRLARTSAGSAAGMTMSRIGAASFSRSRGPGSIRVSRLTIETISSVSPISMNSEGSDGCKKLLPAMTAEAATMPVMMLLSQICRVVCSGASCEPEGSSVRGAEYVTAASRPQTAAATAGLPGSRQPAMISSPASAQASCGCRETRVSLQLLCSQIAGATRTMATAAAGRRKRHASPMRDADGSERAAASRVSVSRTGSMAKAATDRASSAAGSANGGSLSSDPVSGCSSAAMVKAIKVPEIIASRDGRLFPHRDSQTATVWYPSSTTADKAAA